MSQSQSKVPVSYFSKTIKDKIPPVYSQKTVTNALWILRNPIRLSSEEKAELVDFVRANLIGGAK